MNSSQPITLTNKVLEERIPSIGWNVMLLLILANLMGWTITMFIKDIETLQEEQLKQLELIAMGSYTTSTSMVTLLETLNRLQSEVQAQQQRSADQNQLIAEFMKEMPDQWRRIIAVLEKLAACNEILHQQLAMEEGKGEEPVEGAGA
ncbi:hypothetical protein B0T20DRAFT_477452 [Sordaria brevicollis]|uniref:Uncharacterized protein n=1 Tax=Sordaria brevicollis TaxID=83679 RepID=A0AAE0PGV9_SORBR|nr:hypothetical protein B0T20DRAFT_477452 [Sordaria brevicollis]